MIGISRLRQKLCTTLALAVVATATTAGAAPPASGTVCCLIPPTYGAYAFGGDTSGQLGIGGTHPYPIEQVVPTQVVGVETTAGQLAASGYHSVLLRSDGTVAGWGNNEVGEVGDGTTTTRGTPASVPGLTGVTRVAAGYLHTLALRSDGTVWAWGSNAAGQLGDGTMINRLSPVQVLGLTGIVAIAGGYDFSLALSSTGIVYAWGGNANGQMGTAAGFTNQLLPAAVPVLTGISAIGAGAGDTALAVRGDGTVWAWGANFSGQLGDGTTSAHTGPTQVPGIFGAVAVSAGANFSIALGSDGSVWTWGANDRGQLGNGTTTGSSDAIKVIMPPSGGAARVTQIATGSEYVLARTSDSRAIGWGDNSYAGIAGTSSSIQSVPVSIPLARVQQVAAGTYHSLVMTTTPPSNLP